MKKEVIFINSCAECRHCRWVVVGDICNLITPYKPVLLKKENKFDPNCPLPNVDLGKDVQG